MRFAKTTSLIACLAALGLGGCGGGDDQAKQIPAETRQELEKQLESVENRFDSGGGACTDIAENQQSIEATLDSLPPEVEKDVRDALRDGFDRLFELTAEQCDEQKGQETETTPTETETTPTEPTETTPTEPLPTETTQPEEEPEEPKKEKEKENKGTGNGTGGNAVPQAGGGAGGGTVSP